MKWFPSPHSGILFLLAILAVAVLFAIIVSVPSFGDSFFMVIIRPAFSRDYSGFRPLIRGFFFYKLISRTIWTPCVRRFRPLIRGFFFYAEEKERKRLISAAAFPSPHSGILFLLDFEDTEHGILVTGFRPLIRGFFFYSSCGWSYPPPLLAVSVPSFGDSFFMIWRWTR